MNSNAEQYFNCIDILEWTLLQNNISENTFQSFRQSLENIEKLYLEQEIDSTASQYLQNVCKVLIRYFRKNNTGSYEADNLRLQRTHEAISWLKNSYSVKHPAENTEQVIDLEDGTDTTILSDYSILGHQNSTGVNTASSSNKIEKQNLATVEDKNGKEDEQICDKLSKTSEIKTVNDIVNEDTGGNDLVRTEPKHVTSEIHLESNTRNELMYIKKLETEVEGLKKEIESKSQVILDLNVQLTRQTTQNEGSKEHLKTVIWQLESHAADAFANKEEVSKKTLEIENLTKQITDFQKQYLTDINNFQFKLDILQKELEKSKDNNISSILKLSQKDDQLKKLELESESRRNIAVYENKQHQEKSKELQEFKSKSTELQNNLKTKSDELISKLRELSECKSDLVKYADSNGRLCNQLSLLQKDHDDLKSKFKVDSTNYQNDITSLKEKVSSEKETSAELNRQFESAKEDLKKQIESYNKLDTSHKDLNNKFDEIVAKLSNKNATNQKLELKIKDVEMKNFELNKSLARINTQLQKTNKQLLFTEKERREVSIKFDQLQKTLEKTEANLEDVQNKYREENRKNIELENMFKRGLDEQDETRKELLMFIENRFKSVTIKDIITSERESIKANALSQLDIIKTEIDGYRRDVKKFSGNRNSKTFLHLQELIQRSILRIDQIQSQDISEVKEKKRELIKYCHTVDGELQSNVTST